jgi:hypothetical protein
MRGDRSGEEKERTTRKEMETTTCLGLGPRLHHHKPHDFSPPAFLIQSLKKKHAKNGEKIFVTAS